MLKKAIVRNGVAKYGWSCGNNKSIQPGARVFLVRVGKEPKGIVASGRATSRPYRDRHWEDKRRRALYIDVEWDNVLDPESEEILTIGRLTRLTPGREYLWTPRISGIRIPDDIVPRLEQLWKNHCKRVRRWFRLPPELPSDGTYYEGATIRVSVNRHERSRQAREACIARYGYNCVVCGFNFEEVYGKIGRGFIEVHHVTSLSKLGRRSEIRPDRDLVPVCPNCHAMLHRKDPPYTVAELRRRLRRRKPLRERS